MLNWLGNITLLSCFVGYLCFMLMFFWFFSFFMTFDCFDVILNDKFNAIEKMIFNNLRF